MQIVGSELARDWPFVVPAKEDSEVGFACKQASYSDYPTTSFLREGVRYIG